MNKLMLAALIILIVLVMLIGCELAAGATIYASSAVNYRNALAWGVGNMPDSADAVWWFADEIGYDYTNRGKTALASPLIDGVAPALAEGITAPHQSGNTYNAGTTYQYISNSAVLDFTNNSFSVGVVFFYTASGTLLSKKSSAAAGDAGWAIYASGGTDIGGLASDGVDQIDIAQLNVTTSQWHTAMFTLSAAGIAKIFIDGVCTGPFCSTSVAAVGSITNAVNFNVGRRANAASYFNGLECWSGIWSTTALTDAKVLAWHNAIMPSGTSSEPYPSIQSAVYQGVAGDTILVAAGRYQETVVVAKSFAYIGAVTPSFGSFPELYGAALPAAAQFVGMTVSADNELGFLTIRGYSTVTTGIGLLGDATSDGSLFHHLEVDSCRNGIDFDGASDNVELINCVIDGASLANANGFRKTGAAGTVVVENCIIVNTAVGLTKVAGTLSEDYNDFFNNTSNYAAALHASDLLVNPRFRGGNDYRTRNHALVGGTPSYPNWNYRGVYLPGSLNFGGGGSFGRSPQVWGRSNSWGR